MTNLTSTELAATIAETGDSDAYEQLFRKLKPITLHEAQMYIGRMDTYDREDFVQVGMVTAWEIISKGCFRCGNFDAYYCAAVRKKFINIWRDYTLKNPVYIGEMVDCKGNATRILGPSEYGTAYREKHREECRRWYEKKKAAQPRKEKKAPISKEERSRRVCEYQKKYFAEHPEKYAEKKAKEAERQRRRRAEQKAARMAAASL